MTQDPNIVSRLDKYPTDVRLLLCQLVQDAKEESTWEDIYERFINHPLVLRVHRGESGTIRDAATAEELPALVREILSDAVGGPAGEAAPPPPPPTPAAAAPAAPAALAGPALALCCTRLHRRAVAALRRQLAARRCDFAAHLKTLQDQELPALT